MKKLSQIPRNYNAKFCWQNESGPDHYEEQEVKPDVKNIEAKPVGVDTKMFEKNKTAIVEAAQKVITKKEREGLDEWADKEAEKAEKEKVVEVKINTTDDPGIVAASNRDLAIAYEANVDALLSEIGSSMKGTSFESQYTGIDNWAA